MCYYKKSLKIPKWQSEAVIQSTDNTMAKRKRDKNTNNDVEQNITQKTKDQATQTTLKAWGELRCSGRISSSCSTCEVFEMVYVLRKKMKVSSLIKFNFLWCFENHQTGQLYYIQY